MRTGGGWWPALIGIMVLVGVALLGWRAGALPAARAAATNTALVRIGSGETPTYTVAPGGERTITIEVVDAANLGAATLLLAYDPALVQVVSCTAQPPANADLALCNPSYGPGVVRFSLLAAEGVSGAFAAFELTLRAVGASGGTAQLALTAPHFADVNGVEVPVQVTGGTLLISGPDQPAEAVLLLDPAASAITPGQNSTVAIRLDVTPARPVAAATMLLQYDPRVVRPVQCTAPAGSTLQGACNVNFNQAQGLVKFNLLANEGVSGQLHLYDLVFEVVGTAVPGAVSGLTLSVESMVDAQETPLRWRVASGAMTVTAGPSNAARLLVGDVQSSGQYTLEHGAEITVPVWVVDVANLGAATVVLGFDPALLEPLGCMVNASIPGIDGGHCVIEQGRVLANFVAGAGFSGSAPLFEVIFTPRPGAPAGVNAALLLDAANFADVNAVPLPWRGRSGSVGLLPGAPSNAPLFAVDAPLAAPPPLPQGGQVTVTVSISGAIGVGVVTVIVRFDPTVVKVVACTPTDQFDGAACAIGDGEVRITLLSGSGFTGSAMLAELVFQAADEAEVGEQTNLTLTVTNFTNVDGDPLRYQVTTGAIQITEGSDIATDVLLRLTPAFFDVIPGRQFQVRVETLIDALKLPQGLEVVTLRVLYDPAVLRPLACTPNSSAFVGAGCNIASAPGQIRLSLLGGSGGISQVGLAQIRFETTGRPGDSTMLRLGVDTLLAKDADIASYRTQPARVVVTIDGDGVPDEVEHGAPNNGDGNNDGIPDAEQLHVTSLPSPITGNYVTLVGPPGSCLMDLRFLSNPSPTDTPPGWSAVLGYLGFTLGCLPSGSTATVTVILHGESGLDLSRFFIYAPDAGGWQPFLFDGDLGASFTANSIVLQLGDGQRGDNDAAVNGQIEFLGVPGQLGVAIGVVPRSLAITLTRAGSYGVVLLAPPSASVLVNLTTGNGRVAVTPAQLIFTPDNWSVMQTVTVRAASGAPAPSADVIRHSVTSTDAAYHGLAVAEVNVTIEAHGGDPGETLTPTTGTPTIGTPTTGTPTTGTPTTGTPTTGTPTTGTPTTGTPTTGTPTTGTPTTGTPTVTPGPGTPTPIGGGPGVAFLPIILVNTGPTTHNRLYLPLVARAGLPDLVVEQISVVNGALQVTIRNIGSAPVLNEFWVDAYIGPRTPPTAVNQTWDTVGNEGLVWGVTADALPMAPDAALTLSIGDAYFLAAYSSVNLPLTPDRAIYVQVDSYGEVGAYGSVLESHEQRGEVYNNITGPVFLSTQGQQGADALPSAGILNGPLPPRRRFRFVGALESEE